MDQPQCGSGRACPSEHTVIICPSEHTIIIQGRSFPDSPRAESLQFNASAISITRHREPQLEGKVSKREKLTVKEAVEIFAMRPREESKSLSKRGHSINCTSIAHKYGVAPKTVRDIWNGRTWLHATKHLRASDEPVARRYAKEPDLICSKLPPTQTSFHGIDSMVAEDLLGSSRCLSSSHPIRDGQSAVVNFPGRKQCWNHTALNFAPRQQTPPHTMSHPDLLQPASIPPASSLSERQPQPPPYSSPLASSPTDRQQWLLPFSFSVPLPLSPAPPAPPPRTHPARGAAPMPHGRCTLPPLNWPRPPTP
jgi:hypothetical protein